MDLIADNRTFYETDYYQLLADGSLHRLDLPPTAEVNDVFAGRLLVSLKDDWQRGDRKFTRDSVLIADPAALRKTGEGAGRGDIEVLAESTGSEVVLGAVAAKSGILVTVLDNVRGRLYRYEKSASGGGPGGRSPCRTTAAWRSTRWMARAATLSSRSSPS